MTIFRQTKTVIQKRKKTKNLKTCKSRQNKRKTNKKFVSTVATKITAKPVPNISRQRIMNAINDAQNF